MGKFSTLGKNTLLILIGNVTSKMFALLMLPLYTSWLSVEDFGTTDIIIVYSTLLLGVVSCCIAEAIFVIPKGHSIEEKNIYFSSGLFFLIIVSVLSALLWVILDKLFYIFCITNSFSINLWGIYFILITNIFFVYCQQFCRSIDKIFNYSVAGIVLTISTAVYSIIFVPKFGVRGFIISSGMSYLTACLYTIVSAKLYQYVSIEVINNRKVKDLLGYSIPLIPNAIMWWLVSAFNRPLLETYCGMYSIGILAVAGKFPGFLNVFLNSINASWIISVIDEYRNKTFSDFYNRGIQLFVFLLFFCCISFTVFGKNIISFFTLNSSYDQAWIYLPLLAMSTVLSCLSGIIGAVFSAAIKSKYYFYSSIWGAGASVLFNIIFIPWFNLWGAVFANLLSMFVMLVSRIIYARLFVNIKYSHFFLFDTLIYVCILIQTLFFRNFYGWIFTLFCLLLFLYINKNYIEMLLNYSLKIFKSKINYERKSAAN